MTMLGLTDEHPTMTTYFEGEMIGIKYGFTTQHPSWGATEKIDLSHWSKFTAFRPYQKQARKGQTAIKDFAQRENIFMRWKEHFLVPDHRVRNIEGASFEGFYYICFNQVRGEVSGIYFHSKSEKYVPLPILTLHGTRVLLLRQTCLRFHPADSSSWSSSTSRIKAALALWSSDRSCSHMQTTRTFGPSGNLL